MSDGASPERTTTDTAFSPAYRLTTICLVALVTVVAFEFMAISTAMPAVAKELDAITGYGSAFSAMLIGQLLGIVIAGVWCDRAGPLPALNVGQLLFAAGATICALATSFPMLLIGRALTGLGAGAVIVALFVVIGRVYSTQMRPRVFSWISAAWVLPSLIGAPLAAKLTETWTWRLVFWVVVGPTILTFIALLGQRAVIGRPANGAAVDGASSADRSAHVQAARIGTIIALAAGVLQTGANNLSARFNGYAVAAVGGLAAVLLTAPRLLPPRTLVLGRGLPSVIASRFLLNGAFNGALTYVPLMLTNGRGVALNTAGYVLALGSFGWATGSWVQGHSRFDGRRWHLVMAGGISLTAGVAVLAVTELLDLPWWVLIPGVCAGGLGMGLASTTLSVLSLQLSPIEEHGKTSSALQLSDVLGSTIGIAFGSAAFALLHPAYGHGPLVYGAIWVAMTVLASVAIVGGRRCATPA